MHGQPRPQKTALIVAKRIVDDVYRQGLTVGDRLPPEKAMLDDYQIGRGTLRESLRYLELQGVVALKPGPGGGPVIERPDSTPLSNGLLLLLQFSNAPFETVVEARKDLEPIMARHAATRMTIESLAQLEANVEQMRANVNDREIFLALNREFHAIISWNSKNSVYGFLIDALIEIVDGTQFGVTYPDERRKAILRAHDRILKALQAHDGDASESAMAEHMAEFQRYLRRHFDDVLDRTVTWSLL
jgi:DNA-binding FadR family transcriptional regulator